MQERGPGGWQGGIMLLITLGLSYALITACSPSTTANVAVGEIVEGEQGEGLQKDYIVKDKLLAKEIEVLDVKARLVGDFLEGLAIVRNRKKHTVAFEYKFEWYDEDGFPVESNVAHWTAAILYGKETKWIRALCPKPKASGFKVMIRAPNPIER